MQCMSFGGVAWDNNLLQYHADSVPLQESYVTLRTSKNQRLNSTCHSLSSDSEASMAQDSEEEVDISELLNVGAINEEPWEESLLEMDDSHTVTTSSHVFENFSETISTLHSYTPPSRPCTETPPMYPISYAASNNMQPLTNQPQTHYQSCSPYSDMPHSSSSSNFSLDWSSSPQDHQQPTDDFNEIEVSDAEDEGESDYKCKLENHFQNLTTQPELPEIRTMLREKNQNKKQLYQRQFYVPHQSPNYLYGGLHRPRQRSVKQPILSHFLYHALENPSDYSMMIKWVNRSEGIFEFSSKNKESLARAWGIVKNNRQSMTYPKMARALRKYIENGRVLKKMKNRLRYVFLPEFLAELRSGKEPKQLSSFTIRQMYKHSRINYARRPVNTIG